MPEPSTKIGLFVAPLQPRGRTYKPKVRVYRAGWEAVCDTCGECSGLFADNEKDQAQAWVKWHREESSCGEVKA